MASITVRSATADDLADLLALYAEAAEGNPLKSPARQDQAQSSFKAILGDTNRHLCVAQSSGRVVGTADMLIVANIAHHGMPWAVIENVIVTTAARRQGAGTTLIRHLVEIASSAGCYKVQLLSAKHRGPAHKLYEETGFRPPRRRLPPLPRRNLLTAGSPAVTGGGWRWRHRRPAPRRQCLRR